MGEVYEADDRELGSGSRSRRSAPRSRPTRGAVERFKREIHLARQVTHPNVCRIFDLGRPPAADERAAEVLFLTMELLDGRDASAERLAGAARCRRRRRCRSSRQMAAGLAAAHAAGIVHRDFKSGNVMLVPASPEAASARWSPTSASRAGLDLGPATPSITGSGAVVGTPAYMAPEQVEGRAVDAGRRHLRARGRALRDGHRRPALRRRLGHHRGAPEAAGAPGPAARPRPRPAPGLGRRHPPLPQARPDRTVRERRRVRACAGDAVHHRGCRGGSHREGGGGRGAPANGSWPGSWERPRSSPPWAGSGSSPGRRRRRRPRRRRPRPRPLWPAAASRCCPSRTPRAPRTPPGSARRSRR